MTRQLPSTGGGVSGVRIVHACIRGGGLRQFDVLHSVIPAQAGIQLWQRGTIATSDKPYEELLSSRGCGWIPAFAGMTRSIAEAPITGHHLDGPAIRLTNRR